MCLLVVASRIVPGEPLIVGANRDEILERPSTSMTVLSETAPRILGGRDEQSGGTWLAVNEHGVCAGLTNQPMGDAKDPTKRSRGALPLTAVRHASAAAGVAALIAEHDPADYNGAWLLVGDRMDLYFVDFTGARARAVVLAPGIHVLENRTVDEPSPKVDLVRATLGSPAGGDAMVEGFRAVLADHRIPEGDERPNSANCVHLEEFGTRSSCLVRVGAEPAVRPRVWVADGPPCMTPSTEVSWLWDAGGAGGAVAAPTGQSRTSGL
ncbi:MAG TPA: NRDE family protein [Acidimicrobiales bacterium]|nr:NRDE family protein [Acidimicrobiales bacterium]